ncbi:acyltransferase [Massilia sp. YIM B02763]|uniref:acyltransferase family protein n=1 Tax=Massilia sp. YIM B02763 TaxID=3050130 RepID=UPI0025B6382B|nr:acyltransferase [Massilia sp. YIM B02763]MDN4055581.1 acyltransferase [Massilia sp. YIM B02763]
MKLDSHIAQRIAVLRPLLIFGIVFVHVPGQLDRPSMMGSTWFDYVSGFFQLGLFRGTVPMLSLIAGFLLFRAGLDLVPAKLYRKKFKTIAVPFLVFNVLLALLGAAVQYQTGFVYMRNLVGVEARDWVNALFGIKAVPFNYPLYFLRDLIVLIALAPLFGWFLRRRPIVGLLAVALVFGCGFDGFLLRRDSSAVVFYLGGWLALAGRDLRAADRHALPALVLLCLLCAAPMLFRIDDNTFLVYTAPFLIWPAVSLLQGGAAWDWALRMSKYSFFVFVGHAPLLELVYLGHRALLPGLPYEAFWFAGPVLTIAVLVALYRVLMRVAPRAFNAVIGARGEGDHRPVPVGAEQAAKA